MARKKKEKPAKDQLPQGEKKKKSPLKLLLLIIPVLLIVAGAAFAVYFFVLRGGEESVEPNPKELSKTTLGAYAVGEDEVVSLDSVMDEGAAMLTTVEAPTKAAEEQGIDEKTYRYKEAEDPQELAEHYIEVLLGEEQGFTYTDIDNRMLAEDPDLDRTPGSVILAKAAAAESEDADPMTFRVVVAWSDAAIAIQVSHLTGAILPPPEPEQEDSGSTVTNVSEQVAFFENLSPSLLGLEGEAMSEYRLYPLDGWVMVNTYSCRQINVYYVDMPAETNAFQGTYFISGDLQHLFTMDASGNITPIDLG